MPLSPGDKLGPHTILALVGRGGMGEVYRAHDDRLRRDVAIKVSRDQFTERFTREARAIASLNHTNVCHLYDVGPNYLVMEYVEGDDLKGPMSFDEALPIVRQLIDGIEAAHEKNVIHRDLKPANVKITPEGVVKILDFGLAKAAEEAVVGDPSESPTLTMGGTIAGTILGTAAYMSPEQAKGKPVDKRADIFSFGVVVYELLTGKSPFKGETVVESLGAILNKEPDWSAVPARAERLLRWCLQKDRKSRLASISDARLLLEEPAVVAAEPVTVVQIQKEPASKLPWLVAAAALIGAVAFVFWPKPVPELQALRYTIDPPPGFQFVNLFAAGTPSPDGRFIVFSAATVAADSKGKDGPSQLLWLRPTDSLEARPLPGTENGNLPFWSPDGKSIGFVSGGKLKRVEAVGGAPQVLCDVASFEGGTWSKDGVILFSSNNLIHRVAAAGGQAEPVTKSRGGILESHSDPQFLPDGQTFLYRIVSRDGKGDGIYAATLTKPDPPVQLVTGTERKAAYAAPFAGRPGYLLWLRDQTLLAQRFDAAALKLEGDPAPVAEEVLMQTGRSTRRSAFWISQNGLLAYRSGSASKGLQMTWVSRDGKQREPVGNADDFESDFRLSPDGKHVALSRTVAGNQDIWLYEFERGVFSRLTFDPAPEGYPVWSPDSRHVAYASQRSGLSQLFRKDASGAGQEERLHESPLPEEPKDWSRDGKFLLYMSTDLKTGADQWFLPMDGTAPRKPVVVLQTPANEGRSRISPDGKWVAYASGVSGPSQVYIRATPGGPAGQWQVSNAGGDYPRWRGDGKELFFRIGSTVVAAGVKLLADRVEIEAPRELFIFTGPSQGYEPTSDGQRFLVLNPPVSEEGGAGALKIVSNWQALLK